MAEQAREILRTLTSKDASGADRARCEKDLAELPARDVMPLVAREALGDFAHVLARTGAIGNGSGSAEIDAFALPWEWQVFHSLRRVWEHHLAVAPEEELLELLVATSGGAIDVDLARLQLFVDRRTNDPSIGEVALRIMRDARRAEAERLRAAEALLQIDRERYYAEVSDFAATLPAIDALLGPLSRRPAGVGPDPRILRRSFELLAAQVLAGAGNPQSGYFLAGSIADYVGAIAVPRVGDYQSERGLRDAFFPDTVKAVLAWWTSHRASYAG